MEQSPFAELPAELRTSIWEYTLQQDKPITITTHLKTKDKRIGFIMGGDLWVSSSHPPHMLALTATCHAIRRETTKLFYNLNAFKMGTHDDSTKVFNDTAGRCLRNLLKRHISTESFAAIRRVIVCKEEGLDGLVDVTNWFHGYDFTAQVVVETSSGEDIDFVVNMKDVQHSWEAILDRIDHGLQERYSELNNPSSYVTMSQQSREELNVFDDDAEDHWWHAGGCNMRILSKAAFWGKPKKPGYDKEWEDILKRYNLGQSRTFT